MKNIGALLLAAMLLIVGAGCTRQAVSASAEPEVSQMQSICELAVMEVSGDQITITIPEAQVLGCKVDSTSLQEDSYIVDTDSAKISAEDEVKAFEEAQRQLEQNAAADRALSSAQQRAQALLEDYVAKVGRIIGKQYTIRWVCPDGEENPPFSEADAGAAGWASDS